jgi:VWFA-related protein
MKPICGAAEAAAPRHTPHGAALMKRRQNLTSLALLLVLCWPATARAQQEEEGGEFFDTIDVNVVNVEVYVTDRRGQAISGLTREDFEIFEDGRPMTITNFYTMEAEEADAPRALPLEPGVPGADRSMPTPDEQRLYLVVYIDNFNIRPFNRNRVFRRLREFLHSHVKADDRVMLVTYDRSFNVRVPFTSDPTLINSALFDVERMTGHGVHHDSDRRDVLDYIDNSESIGDALGRVRMHAGSLHNDLMFTIDAMRKMVDHLGGLPGRKALLYVSDGLPMVAGEDLFLAVHEKFQSSSGLLEAREYDASRRFHELAAQANTNRTTFYTIDAGGLRTHSSVSVERSQPGLSTFIEAQYIHNLQAPLLRLAEATGGRAILNTNDVGAGLEEVGRELRSYYSLGYQPVRAGSGRYHRIEVKVKQRGLRVRHREGYRDKSVEQRMEEGTLAALMFDEHTNPWGMEVSFGDAMARQGGHFLVPVRVRIPLDRVILLPQHDAHHRARLKLFLAAMDSDGDFSPVQSARIPIEIPDGEVDVARGKHWAYEVTLLMRRGPHRVAVGIRDELAAESAFVTGQLRVGQ